MNKIVIVFLQLLIVNLVWSQNKVNGIFTGLANSHVKLKGYSGFKTYTIDSVQVNEMGEFCLSFSKDDEGIGYLLSENNKSFVVILSKGENLKLKGVNFELLESIQIMHGRQNQLFEQYALEYPRREQCLNAWYYLAKIYKHDQLFSKEKAPLQTIQSEIKRIKAEDSLFLADSVKGSFLSYYMPLRKLSSSVSTIANSLTDEIPATISAFRKIDYTDPRLYKSGLLKDIIESHFWLIENGGYSVDSMYIEMQSSIDFIQENLQTNEQKSNEILEYLFNYFEQHSLFPASKYLALKMLNKNSCLMNNNFASKLESYRAMEKGKIAPDIVFDGDVFAPSYVNVNKPKKLSEVKSKYTVIVFGASWCPQCPKELIEINKNYESWKKQGVEVVFVSLDEDKEHFKNFASIFPFISICDYKKWDSNPVKDYYVFGTPTMYLLNNKHEILLRPNSVKQMDAWVDWFLVKGNK